MRRLRPFWGNKMKVELNTIFRWCNDVATMRHFYTECLGLAETYFRDDEAHGWLTYQVGEVQLVFTRTDEPLSVASQFAQNPGYAGGDLRAESWVLKLERPSFDTIAQRLQTSDYPLFSLEPIAPRPGALQLLALDPMGFTVEIYTEFEAP